MLVGWEAKAMSQQMKPIRKKKEKRKKNIESICLISRGDSKGEPMNSISGFPGAACCQEHS